MVGECKGRTQNEGNLKINPGLAGDCRLENRTEELGGRKTLHQSQEKDQINSLLR